MSRREREERMRAAAPKRDAYLAQQAAVAPKPPVDGGRGSTHLLLAAGIALAIAGGVLYALVLEPWWDRRQLVAQQGRPRGATFGDGVVALFDDVDVEHRDREDPRRDRRVFRSRVTVLDRTSGARVAQHLFDDSGGCVPASPGRVWCDLGPLAVHDAHTFARLATFDDVVAKAGLGRLVARRWTVGGATATQLLDDGRAAIVDAATLSARLADQVPPALRDDPISGLQPLDATLTMPAGCERTPPASTLTADGQTWTIEGGGALRAHIRRQGGATSAGTFLNPTLLAAVDGTPLVLHHTSVEAARDHGQISRLGPTGAVTWTVDLGATCAAWRLEEGTLVVATDAAQGRALGIDVRSGAVRWRFSF